jgi:hypothetical protein
MTTTRAIRNLGFTSFRGVLLAGAVALAVTASGCFGDPGNGYGNGNGYGGSCAPDLLVDWQIQNSTGAPETCDGAGAATVNAAISSAAYPTPANNPQPCAAGFAAGQIDAFLPATGTYDVTVSLLDSTGKSLAPALSNTFVITSCGTSETPTPAVLSVPAS